MGGGTLTVDVLVSEPRDDEGVTDPIDGEEFEIDRAGPRAQERPAFRMSDRLLQDFSSAVSTARLFEGLTPDISAAVRSNVGNFAALRGLEGVLTPLNDFLDACRLGVWEQVAQSMSTWSNLSWAPELSTISPAAASFERISESLQPSVAFVSTISGISEAFNGVLAVPRFEAWDQAAQSMSAWANLSWTAEINGVSSFAASFEKIAESLRPSTALAAAIGGMSTNFTNAVGVFDDVEGWASGLELFVDPRAARPLPPQSGSASGHASARDSSRRRGRVGQRSLRWPCPAAVLDPIANIGAAENLDDVERAARQAGIAGDADLAKLIRHENLPRSHIWQPACDAFFGIVEPNWQALADPSFGALATVVLGIAGLWIPLMPEADRVACRDRIMAWLRMVWDGLR